MALESVDLGTIGWVYLYEHLLAIPEVVALIGDRIEDGSLSQSSDTPGIIIGSIAPGNPMYALQSRLRDFGTDDMWFKIVIAGPTTNPTQWSRVRSKIKGSLHGSTGLATITGTDPSGDWSQVGRVSKCEYLRDFQQSERIGDDQWWQWGGLWSLTVQPTRLEADVSP